MTSGTDEKMEGKWVYCGANVVAADVVRWSEPVFVELGKRRKKSYRVGRRCVTGQLLRLDDLVDIEVRSCVTVIEEDFGVPVKDLPKGERITRRRATLTVGQAHRLLWSDESARDLQVSVHMRAEPESAPLARPARPSRSVGRGRGQRRSRGPKPKPPR